MPRVILHADLNNFFASVSCKGHPSLMEVPVAVCGDPEKRHGIVLAKNTPAKKLGIKTGQAIWQARELCPHLITVGVDGCEVQRMSRVVRAIFSRYTSHVQPFGSDEAWLDISGPDTTIREGVRIANHLRHTIREETGLTASVGVSDNRIFAKLGSDLKKPDAVSVICKQNRARVLDPLPVSDLLFIGKATTRKLNSIGIYTVGQLTAADPRILQGLLGKTGRMLSGFAHGDDASGVMASDAVPAVKSVGNSITAAHDLCTDDDARITLYGLCESVGMRLRRQGLQARVVELSMRDTSLVTTSRQCTLPVPTNLCQDLFQATYTLLGAGMTPFTPLRSMGISVSRLSPAQDMLQLSFLPQDIQHQRQELLEHALDDIRSRYGYFAIRRAIMLTDQALGQINPAEQHVLVPEPYFKSAKQG
ncbi:MAG: DNA polymerase IV [Clostridiales bacterium]|nr:DNA polymerase IV [Clostridiales bacterium]